MDGFVESREERRPTRRAAAALAAVGLASFQWAGLLHYHLFRSGGEFDRNFLTVALLRVEEALGWLPSLLLAGLVLSGGVSTFVNGALRAPFGKAVGLAGSVLFAASFLALVEGPSQGGWVGTRLGESIVSLVGRWGGAAFFGASAVLALGLATDGFFVSAGEGGGERPVSVAGEPKSEEGDGRYGLSEWGDRETSAVNRAKDRRTEGHEDGGFDARVRRGSSERRSGDGLRSVAGVPDAEVDGGAVPSPVPAGAARRGRHPPGDVDRRRSTAPPDAGPAEGPGQVGTDAPAERPQVGGGQRRVEAGARSRQGPPATGGTAVGGGSVAPGSHPVPGDENELVGAAADAVFEAGRASVSVLQGRLRVPFIRASRLLERLQRLGLVGPYRGGSTRDILLTRAEWEKRPRGA